jgi:CheY-like chemotaxis protein
MVTNSSYPFEDFWCGRGHLGQPGCVLFVDDDDAVRESCSDLLEYFGFLVILASDGMEALEIFGRKHDKLDCVILDADMPRMDGLTAFSRILEIC